MNLRIRGMLEKAASGVLALLPNLRARRLGALRRSRSRTESTLRASKGLRPCWMDFFEHSLSLMVVAFPGAFMRSGHAIFNRPIRLTFTDYVEWEND